MFAVALALGCGDADRDGDGFPESTDCNDYVASIAPGADEVPYDGVDQDCDGGDVIDPDGSGTEPIVGCNPTIDGGGWTLTSNRQADSSKIEDCGSNLAAFFTAGCGTAEAHDEFTFYAMTATDRAAPGAAEMLFTQYSDGIFDPDDA